MTAAAKPSRTVPLPLKTSPTLASASADMPRPDVARADIARPASGPSVLALPGAPKPQPMDAAQPATALHISHFIELEIEARRCTDLETLRFSIVNATRKIAEFDQAFLIEPGLAGSWIVTRASSVSKVDRNTGLVRAIEAWTMRSAASANVKMTDPRLANIRNEATLWGIEHPELPFAHAFWLPITARDGRILAALLALKSDNWRPQHSTLLLPLAGAYGHAWEALAPRGSTQIDRARGQVSKSRVAWALALICLVAAFIPVPLSALAPAEVVATEPNLVTAPIEGVVGDVLVPPGAWVEMGTPIVRFVDVKLRNDVEVAKRTRAVAQARYFKVVQSATATQKDMQELATAKAAFDLASAELDYAAELLARSEIKAERAGVLIYSSKSDLLGKPVAVGERLMEIGDPARSEIKIELPVSDAIALNPGGTVALFLDGDPLRAIGAHVVRANYRPTLTADQQLAFRVQAAFADGQARRIGLRGVARVNGDPVSLWFYLLRRPIAAVRQKVGL